MVNVKVTALLALPLLAYAAPLLDNSARHTRDINILENADVDTFDGLVTRSRDSEDDEIFARSQEDEELEALIARSEDFDDEQLFTRSEDEDEFQPLVARSEDFDDELVARSEDQESDSDVSSASIERRQRLIPPGALKGLGQALGKTIFKGHGKANQATSGGNPAPKPEPPREGFSPKGGAPKAFAKLIGLKGAK